MLRESEKNAFAGNCIAATEKVAGMVVAGAVGARHYVMVRHPKRYAEMVEALERVRPLRWKT